MNSIPYAAVFVFWELTASCVFVPVDVCTWRTFVRCLQFTVEDVLAALRDYSTASMGRSKPSSVYKGVSKHIYGKWEARIGGRTKDDSGRYACHPSCGQPCMCAHVCKHDSLAGQVPCIARYPYARDVRALTHAAMYAVCLALVMSHTQVPRSV